MAEPTVSVLVATLGDAPGLSGCLAALRRQADPRGAELVVVFNRARAEVREQAAKAGAIADRVLFEAEAGKSNALNRGVEACRGEVIAFTDDDAVPTPGWLGALTGPLCDPARPPRVAGCGGPVEPIFPPGAPRWFRRLVRSKPSHFLGPHHRLPAGSSEYEWAPGRSLVVPLGANCAYRREVFARARYDPALGPNRATGLRGGEDTLLAVELLRGGDRILYRPDARVGHPVEPERMDPAFVARCYYAQGLESAALRSRGYGRGVPTPDALARKLARAERRVRWLRWLGPAASRRARFEREYRRGLVRGLAGDPSVSPRTASSP